MRFLALALFSLSFTVHSFAQLVDTAWVRTFPAGTGNHAQLTAMELDSSGNPVVIGWTSTPATNDDFLVLKLLADGDTAWLRTFDFAEHGDDRATAISIDMYTNVMAVSGACDGGQYSSSLLLSREGGLIDTVTHQMAEVVWNQLLLYSPFFEHWVLGVAGEGIVPGNHLMAERRSKFPGLGDSQHQFAKFKPVCGAGVAVGVAYMCGASWTTIGWNIVTTRLGFSGIEVDTSWMRLGQETFLEWMIPSSLAPAADGGVFATGHYRETMVTPAYEWHFKTYRYDVSGAELWTANYQTCGGVSSATLVDASGNLIVQGSAMPTSNCDVSTGDTTEILILKYDSDGNLDWDIRYSAPDIVRHDVVAGAVDPAGNIYVVANVFADPAVEDYDVLVAKFNTAGGLVWTYTYASGAGEDDLAKTIRLDDANNIYIGGTSAGDELFVIKLAQSAVVEVADDEGAVPTAFELSQNFPNPFNPTTEIEFSLLRSGEIELDVFNVSGQLVRSLIHEELAAGRHRVAWDATDNSGRAVASGVYFYRISTAGSAESRKMLLLR